MSMSMLDWTDTGQQGRLRLWHGMTGQDTAGLGKATPRGVRNEAARPLCLGKLVSLLALPPSSSASSDGRGTRVAAQMRFCEAKGGKIK